MSSPTDSTSGSEPRQPSAEELLEDSPSPPRFYASDKDSQTDITDSTSSTDSNGTDDADDADEPLQSQISLGTPMPNGRDTPMPRTLARITISGWRPSTGEAGPLNPHAGRNALLPGLRSKTLREREGILPEPLFYRLYN